MTFITGVRITPAGESYVLVGYLNPGGEQTFSVADKEAESVVGFNLAVGPYGIHALQGIFSDKSTSHWIGIPEGVPRGRLVGPDGIVHGLKAAFDVSKTTLFAIDPCAPWTTF